MMTPYDFADIFGFSLSGISGAEVICYIGCKSGTVKESFDIPGLTVAD